MSDAQGRLHIHLHARSVFQYWKDEGWQNLTAEKMLKYDKEFESELLDMARAKVNDDSKVVEDEFDESLTVRRAMQNAEMGANRMTWSDRGYQRILSLAGSGNSRQKQSSSNSTFIAGMFQFR